MLLRTTMFLLLGGLLSGCVSTGPQLGAAAKSSAHGS